MPKYSFTIIASGMDPEAEDFEDRFFEAGCDDATLSIQKGHIIVEFNRESESFSKAVTSALDDVGRAGAHISRVEPDHLVNASEIAERANITRQAISLYARAERGSEFPHPVAKVTSRQPLWDWHEVAEWLFKNGKISREEVVRAQIVKEANLHLETTEQFTRRLQELETA